MEKITPALYALERLHAELGGQILENKKEADRLAESMIHVEAVLKMLQPGYSVRSIATRRRKPNVFFKRGTVFRHAIDVLRTAEKPLTATEITERMISETGVKDPSKSEVWTVYGAVKASLRNNDEKVVESVGVGVPLRWKLKATGPGSDS